MIKPNVISYVKTSIRRGQIRQYFIILQWSIRSSLHSSIASNENENKRTDSNNISINNHTDNANIPYKTLTQV